MVRYYHPNNLDHGNRGSSWAYIRIKEGCVALVLVAALKRADKQVSYGEISVCPSQHPHHTIPRPVGKAVAPSFTWMKIVVSISLLDTW